MKPQGFRILIVGVACLLAGCRPAHQLETAPVRGKVTLDGQPLASGYVMALPTRGRMARGAIQPDGSFALGTYGKADGAQIGKHPVVVTSVPSDESGGKPPKNAKPIPKKYGTAQSSGLTVNVESSGLDEWLIELTSSDE